MKSRKRTTCATSGVSAQSVLLAIVTVAAIASSSWAVVVKTSDGNGADTELREDERNQRGGAKDLNTRWEANPSNLETIALRLELGAIDPALIANASLELTVNRSGMPNNNGLNFYGLSSEVAGQDWEEGMVNMPWNAANPFPGMIFDDDVTTFPINHAETTSLGSTFWATGPSLGSTVALASPELTSFLHDAGELVTLFVFRNNVTGTQMRFASKETVNLGDTGTSMPFGTGEHAPRLVFDLLPPAAVNIYKWEYVDPMDPAQGKQPSPRLAPDGYGLEAQPGLSAGYLNLKMAYLIGEDLTGAHFGGTNLSQADLSQANLSGAYLFGATFKSATLNNADLAGAEIGYANFEGAGLTVSQLLSTSSYQNGFLSGVKVPGMDASGINFSGKNLFEASFAGGNLTGADFTGASVDGADFSYTGFTASQLASTLSHQSAYLAYVKLSGNDLTGVNLTGQYMYGANLAAANLTQANFSDAYVAGVDFTGADFTDAHITRGNFGRETFLEAGGLTPAQLYDTVDYQAGDLSLIGFNNNLLAGATLTGINLSQSQFFRADLTGADLSGSTLGYTYLHSANLTGADLSQANLMNANLAYATLLNAIFTGADVRSAIFSADYFAGLGGIAPNQLYTTASYLDSDLTGIDLSGNDLTNANFIGQNLTSARFDHAILSGADFTDAIIAGASFRRDASTALGGLTAGQIYSTASYLAGELTGIQLINNQLSSINLANQNLELAFFSNAELTSADFSNSDLGNTYIDNANLTSANLSGVDLRGAYLYLSNFTSANLSGADLRDASFYAANLSSADLSNANLTNTYLGNVTLTDADLSGAVLRGANLYYVPLSTVIFANADIGGAALGYTNLSLAQIYSTASYATGDFTGINFDGLQLDGAQFSGRNFAGSSISYGSLNNADFRGANLVNSFFVSTQFQGADFSLADLRSTYGLDLSLATLTNTILSDSRVAGLDLRGGLTLVVRDFGSSGFGALPILIEAQLTLDTTSTLQLVLDGDNWDSTIFFEAGIPVTLGGTLELLFAPDVNVAQQRGKTFQLFNWDGVSFNGLFDVESPHWWDLSQLHTTGQVTLLAVPEPGAMSLLALAAFTRVPRRMRAIR